LVVTLGQGQQGLDLGALGLPLIPLLLNSAANGVEEALLVILFLAVLAVEVPVHVFLGLRVSLLALGLLQGVSFLVLV